MEWNEYPCLHGHLSVFMRFLEFVAEMDLCTKYARILCNKSVNLLS